MARSGADHRRYPQPSRPAGQARARSGGRFIVAAGLVLVCLLALAEVHNRGALAPPSTSVPQLVPAAAFGERHNWASNSDFAQWQGQSPSGWQPFEVTDAGARLARGSGETYLRLECGESACIAGLWQRYQNLPPGDYSIEADVYLAPAGGAAAARLGYDARGGVAAAGAEVVWSPPAAALGWQTATWPFHHQGGPATVFVIFDRLLAGGECRLAGARLLGPEPEPGAAAAAAPSLTAATATDGGILELRAVYVRVADLRWSGPSELEEVARKAAGAGFNAIYFQVREQGYAYYRSGVEPVAAALAGSDWDPLAAMARAAHAEGLQLHAWLDLAPIWRQGEPPPPTIPQHAYNLFTARFGIAWLQGESLAPALGQTLYASPAHAQVRAFWASVCADIAARYDVDGLHLTSFGYAGAQYGAADPAFDVARGQRATLTLAQWRAEQVTAALEGIALAVAAVRPECELSVGVWPVASDAWGWGLGQGYADFGENASAWLGAGLVDSATVSLFREPRLAEPERMQALLRGWRAASRGRPLVAGLGAGSASSLRSGIVAARQAGADGVAIYAYGDLERGAFWQALASGPFSEPASPPP